MTREETRASERERNTSSSGGWAVKRRRLTGNFDVGSAHRALELLSENSLYGSLTISDGLHDVSFFFTRGGLRLVAAGRQLPSLRDRLHQQGQLEPADVKQVESEVAKRRADASKIKDVGILEREVLIEQLRFKPEDVDNAARQVIGEVFLDCLFWEDPQFEAVTGEPDLESMQRSDLSALTLSLGVQDLVERMQQKIRTISDVRKTVASLDVLVEATTAGREAVSSRKRLGEGPIGERRTKLMRIVANEQGQTAEALRQRLGSGELEIASLLHELVVEGYVELRRGARDRKAELERLRKMEEGVDQAINQLLRRMRLADDSAKVGETSKAARHMARAGGLLLEEGRADEAARAFSGALKHSDDDLEAREGYVQSLWGVGRASEALDQSEELGRRYLELNLPGRAKRVLEKALGREERTGTLELLVGSLVKLRQPKAAADAGERLVNRLRREGRRDEAREMAGKLIALTGDPEDRARLLRALGVDRRRSIVLAVTLVVFSLLVLPAQARLSARQDFADRAFEAARRLNSDGQDPDAVAGVLADLQGAFKELAERGGEVGQQAALVTDRLDFLRHDEELYRQRLRRLLPWQAQSDVSLVLVELQALLGESKSAALQGPLRRLVARIEGHVESADAARQALYEVPAGSKARAAAQAFKESYGNLPAQLDQAKVRMRVTSEPPGARVEWAGIQYSESNTTPLDLSMSLVGETTLRLWLDGFEPVTRRLTLDDLSEVGEYRVELDPARRRGRDPRVDPTPRPSPTPTPSETPVIRRRPAPSPTSAPQPRRVARIQVVEGHLSGGEGGRFAFSGGDELRFARHELPRTYRCDLTPLHVVEGRRVYLVGIRVVIMVRRGGRWVSLPPYDYDLGERFQRGQVALPTGVIEIQPLARTIHLEQEWFVEEVQEAIDEAVYAYKRRRDR